MYHAYQTGLRVSFLNVLLTLVQCGDIYWQFNYIASFSICEILAFTHGALMHDCYAIFMLCEGPL